jgi:hypothetical protein
MEGGNFPHSGCFSASFSLQPAGSTLVSFDPDILVGIIVLPAFFEGIWKEVVLFQRGFGAKFRRAF